MSRPDPTPINEPMSPLRARMLEDMRLRQLGRACQLNYVRAAKAFSTFLGRSPEMATPEDVRPFPVAPVGQRREAADLQCHRLGPSVPVHRDHEPARPFQPAAPGARAAQAARGDEPGGGGPADRSAHLDPASNTRPCCRSPTGRACASPKRSL